MDSEPTGAILFDLDGVLVDSEHQEAATVMALLDGLGVRLESWQFVRAVHGVPRAELAASLAALDACREHHGVLERAFVDDVEIVGVVALPGVPTALQHVRDRGFACAVASNSPREHIVERLRQAELERFGLPVFSARDRPNPKPAPDVFLHAQHEIGAADLPTVVIEDSLTGARAAAAARLPAVLVNDIGPLPTGCVAAHGIVHAVDVAIEIIEGKRR